MQTPPMNPDIAWAILLGLVVLFTLTNWRDLED